MQERGELKTYGGRITPVAVFLSDVASDLEGCRVHRIASDSYKDSEVRDFLQDANLRWAAEFRRVGQARTAGATFAACSG